jgi:hypothetical membrane protein
MNARAAATGRLLLCGAAAGPIYLIVGFVHALLRPGFDMSRHALSLLSLGELGWIQIANFTGTGTLVVLGALGVRRALPPGRGSTWVPVLLGVWGVALVASGVFTADPAPDFPPGHAGAANGLSSSGLLHFVFGAAGFYALAAAALILARRYWDEGRKGRSLYTLASATGFLVAFGAIASGRPTAFVMLTFYAAVAWIWVWHTTVFVDLRRAAGDGLQPASWRPDADVSPT